MRITETLTEQRLGVDTPRLLARLRKRAKLSQDQAAERLGFSSNGPISARESGATSVELDEVFDIARIYGLTRAQVDEEIEVLEHVASRVRVAGSVPAGPPGLLAPLSHEDARNLPSGAVAFVPVPDDSMADALTRGERAVVRPVDAADLPGAIHGKIVYVIFAEGSAHGEPEFAQAVVGEGDSIILSKLNPGKSRASFEVDRSDIFQVGLVIGACRPVNRRFW